jgi:hypothetical protein
VHNFIVVMKTKEDTTGTTEANAGTADTED